jgi:uncharacterized protein YecE (DUF72 family)
LCLVRWYGKGSKLNNQASKSGRYDETEINYLTKKITQLNEKNEDTYRPVNEKSKIRLFSWVYEYLSVTMHS